MKPTEQFGPFPALYQHLALGGAAVHAAPAGVGDLWAAVGEERGLYAPLGPRAIDPAAAPLLVRAGGGFASRVRALLDGVRPLMRRRAETSAPPDLSGHLVACHGWLAKQNVRWAHTLFAPFWRDIPPEFAVTSEKAVAWGVIGYALAHRGSIPWNAPAMQTLSFTADDPLGDLISLHLMIEKLMLLCAARIRLTPMESKQRRLGGLRRGSFLTLYPALRSSRNGAGWRAALDQLIDHSPLTRLIYADLVTRGGVIVDAEGNSSLSTETSAGFFPLMHAPALKEKAVSPRGWRSLWVSHLARSLVAVMLNPTPGFEDRVRVEQKLSALKARPNPDRSAVEACENLLGGAQALEHEQYLARLAFVRAVLCNSDTVSDSKLTEDQPSTRSAPPVAERMLLLHLRMLDMLGRQLALENEAKLIIAFKSKAEKGAKRRGDVVFLDKTSPLYAAFIDTVLGQPLDRWREVLTKPEWANVFSATRANLGALFDMNRDQDASALDKAAGLIEGESGALLSHFENSLEKAIEMPYALRWGKSYAPGHLFRVWQRNALEELNWARTTVSGGIAEIVPD